MFNFLQQEKKDPGYTLDAETISDINPALFVVEAFKGVTYWSHKNEFCVHF